MKLIDILVEELPKRGGWPGGAAFVAQEEGGWLWSFTAKPQKDCDDEWMDESSSGYHNKVGKLPEASDHDTSSITREQYESALAAKNEGWIEWGGGECPVPRGTLVDVKYLCGDVNRHIKAGEPDSSGSIDTAFAVRWSKLGAEYDIIAYRLHKPKEAEQVRAAAWNAYAGITKEDDKANLKDCIEQDAAPVWNGLPQVGCVCEHSWAGDEWQRCKILFTSNQLVVVKLKESGREDAYNIGDVIFRPIRTEEDKKREAAIKELTSVICGEIPDTGMATAAMYAARVYDAGYRK